MNKIEELKFIIGRFDHYFDSVNGKGNLYLTLNTFLLAGAIAGYAGLLSAKICNLAWSELGNHSVDDMAIRIKQELIFVSSSGAL